MANMNWNFFKFDYLMDFSQKSLNISLNDVQIINLKTTKDVLQEINGMDILLLTIGSDDYFSLKVKK